MVVNLEFIRHRTNRAITQPHQLCTGKRIRRKQISYRFGKTEYPLP